MNPIEKLSFISEDTESTKNVGSGSEGSVEVLKFISDFYICFNKDETKHEQLRYLFMNVYCYYFAHMLKLAFNRGEVCICAPFSHFVWVDMDKIPYDIEGVSASEYDYLIPETYLGDAVNDFLHAGRDVATTKKM